MEGERLRARAPEVRDTDIDDALEEAWGAVHARQGSKRSKVFIVHFDNRKSQAGVSVRVDLHPSAERNRELGLRR